MVEQSVEPIQKSHFAQIVDWTDSTYMYMHVYILKYDIYLESFKNETMVTYGTIFSPNYVNKDNLP